MDVAHAPVISRRSLVLVFALALGVGFLLSQFIIMLAIARRWRPWS